MPQAATLFNSSMMPMVLRSRRSIHPAQPEGVELQATPTRRSTRLQAKVENDEDSDESDSEPVPSQVMERDQAEVEEDAAEEAEPTELKHCSVLLDRLNTDEKTKKKELEEKEDMNPKGGKSISRIPTFQKRPVGTRQTTELSIPRRDIPDHVAQPPEKAGGGSVEASKSKPAEVRETALLLPTVRSPKITSDSPSASGGVEQTISTGHSSATNEPKCWNSFQSGQCSLLIASPRPALRPEHDMRNTPETEASTVPDPPGSYLPSKSSLSQKPWECTRVILAASGDSDGIDDIPEDSQVEAIMDEEPPWETEPVEITEQKDSRSSSDIEHEDDLGDENSEDDGSEHVEECHEQLASKPEFLNFEEKKADESTFPVAPKEVAEINSASSNKRSGCSWLFLLWLLLLGGFGQHIWHYGLPTSVAQLTAQLELHWLEGLRLLTEPCSEDCRVHLVESIPVGLYPSFKSPRPSISDSWLHLLDKANRSVHIAAFYFTLRGNDVESTDPSDSQGRKVFDQLKQLESKGIKLQIAVNTPQKSTQETAELAATGAQVREVDLKAVTGGIVHTKLWVLDQKHFYLGSANMDWRSLSQVKEVGLSVEDCSCLAQDAFRIFEVYWSIGRANDSSLPPFWPARLSALSSANKPLNLKLNGVPARVYLSSAPPQISARGRSDDLSSILSVINDAQKFIFISVMDYLPLSQFTEPLRFWPAIDSDLRAAACTRGVQVRLMVSCWENSPASMFTFLQSLLVLGRPPLNCNIEVKIFTVPSTAEQMKIPFARVNHAKYMVTDRVLYIGTSNWSENYFTHTAGVGLVVNQTGSLVEKGQETLQSQAEELFLRDWSSPYTRVLSVDDTDVCPRHRY